MTCVDLFLWSLIYSLGTTFMYWGKENSPLQNCGNDIIVFNLIHGWSESLDTVFNVWDVKGHHKQGSFTIIEAAENVENVVFQPKRQ